MSLYNKKSKVKHFSHALSDESDFYGIVQLLNKAGSLDQAF